MNLLRDAKNLVSRKAQPRSSGEALSLGVNFSWTFTGNIVYSASQWGMLTVLAKLGSPEVVGRFALGFAITAPVIMFANLQLRGVQATDAKYEYRFGDYLSLRLITTALALLVIVGIVFESGYSWQIRLPILAIGVAKGFEAISDIFYGLLQQHEQMDHIAKSMMIKGLLSLLALGVGFYLTHSILWGTVVLAICWALILVGYDARNGAMILKEFGQPGGMASGQPSHEAALRPYWDVRTLARLAWLALPLGIVMALNSLNTNIPRYFLQRYLGERELGIFAAMAYIMVLGSTVVGALGQAATPRLSKYYAAGDSMAFRTLLLKLIGIGVMLGVLGVLAALVAGRPILTLLYRPEYAEIGVFVWLMVALGITNVASFLGYGMTAARYFRAQIPLAALVAASTTVGCMWLIPADGLRGAVIALIVATTIQVIGLLVILSHALQALQKYTQEAVFSNEREQTGRSATSISPSNLDY